MSRYKIIQNLGIVETVGKQSKPNGDLLLRAKPVSARCRQSDDADVCTQLRTLCTCRTQLRTNSTWRHLPN